MKILKKPMTSLDHETFAPAMVRAMAARDRQVVACVFAAVILFHVALLVVGNGAGNENDECRMTNEMKRSVERFGLRVSGFESPDARSAAEVTR